MGANGWNPGEKGTTVHEIRLERLRSSLSGPDCKATHTHTHTHTECGYGFTSSRGALFLMMTTAEELNLMSQHTYH